MTEDTLVVHPASDTLHTWIQEYYGKILTNQGDLKTNACCASGEPAPWIKTLLGRVHEDVLERFYGCGFPIPEAVYGSTVLDLGCGSGRDAYLISQVVGERGWVHGVDMTLEQLAAARSHLDWHKERFGYEQSNVRFHHGFIEELESLPLDAASVDVAVSNCVVNLSPRKDRVLAGAYALLKPGGEFLLSDVVVDRRLPHEVRTDPWLQGECLGGALYLNDLLDLARRSGFRDPRVVSRSPISIENEELRQGVGPARFSSITLRLFKLEDLEPRCEDYGQTATYHGTIPHAPDVFWLDDHHAFESGRPERVCGNTAEMLSMTRFAPHFSVTGDRSVHFGEYPCGPTLAADLHQDADGGGSACC